LILQQLFGVNLKRRGELRQRGGMEAFYPLLPLDRDDGGLRYARPHCELALRQAFYNP
jgi:hypothetical protein